MFTVYTIIFLCLFLQSWTKEVETMLSSMLQLQLIHNKKLFGTLFECMDLEWIYSYFTPV